jgi:hypothetical protein
MKTKLIKLLLLVSLNSAAEKAPQKGREKAIAKLLAALTTILQRADLGRIKIEPSGDGNSFTTEIFYKSLPKDTTQSHAQAPATKTIPETGTLPQNPATANSKNANHQAGLCQCSRCAYIRKDDK